jgi:hypothetical protein
VVTPALDPRRFYDLGHQGDVDRTQIRQSLALSPTERLRRHEGWRRLFREEPGMPNFLEDVVTRMSAGGVEFVIVGGVSAVLQGAPVATQDLDLCYRRTPENIARLVAALAPLTPRPRGFPPELPFFFDERTVQRGANFTLDVGGESLDLLGEMSGIGGYEQIIRETEMVRFAGVEVRVLSLAQLIATKEAAGREKDLAVLPLLRATLEDKQRRSE